MKRVWVHPEMDFKNGGRETSKEQAARMREPLSDEPEVLRFESQL